MFISIPTNADSSSMKLLLKLLWHVYSWATRAHARTHTRTQT